MDKTAWGFSIMGDIGCKIVRCVCERVSACVRVSQNGQQSEGCCCSLHLDLTSLWDAQSANI